MNTFWKHNRNLTEHGLDSFTGSRDQEILPWLMLSLGIAFSCNHHFYVFSFQAVFLVIIVCISAWSDPYSKPIPSTTASRNLKEAFNNGTLEKTGDKRLTKYRFK